MEKTGVYIYPDSHIMPPYIIIATLFMLLDKCELTNEIKKHCKTGLKVIAIIHNNPDSTTKTNLLTRKKFDAFFALFPPIYFNDRKLIPTNMIFDNIIWCLKTNTIVNAIL